jgi:hypothetical protein
MERSLTSRIRGCIRTASENEVKEKLTKLEGRVGRDARYFLLAVGHGSRDGQLTLSTSLHANDADVPAWPKSKSK